MALLLFNGSLTRPSSIISTASSLHLWTIFSSTVIMRSSTKNMSRKCWINCVRQGCRRLLTNVNFTSREQNTSDSLSPRRGLKPTPAKQKSFEIGEYPLQVKEFSRFWDFVISIHDLFGSLVELLNR